MKCVSAFTSVFFFPFLKNFLLFLQIIAYANTGQSLSLQKKRTLISSSTVCVRDLMKHQLKLLQSKRRGVHHRTPKLNYMWAVVYSNHVLYDHFLHTIFGFYYSIGFQWERDTSLLPPPKEIVTNACRYFWLSQFANAATGILQVEHIARHPTKHRTASHHPWELYSLIYQEHQG